MQRIISTRFKRIGDELIQTMDELIYLRASNAKIAYLVSDVAAKESKTKYKMADTEVIPDKYKWGMNEDFAITFYEPNIADLNEKQLQILVFQQLLKCGVTPNPDNAEEKYSIIEPDVCDFKIIINRYGTDWWEQPKLDLDLD